MPPRRRACGGVPRRREPPVRYGLRRLRVLAALLVVGGASYALLVGPLCAIDSIEANVPPSCQEIVEAAAPLGQNLFLFRTGPLEAAIAEDPLVESVSVERILPRTIRIAARTRQGRVRVRTDDGEYEVDRLGVPFRPSVGEELPLLVGAEKAVGPGGRISPDVVATVVTWLDAAERYHLSDVAKVDYLGNGCCNLATAEGRLVKLGTLDEIDKKLAAAAAILGQWGDEIAYVDVEVPDQPVFGRRSAPVAASAIDGTDPRKTRVNG